LVAVPRVSAYLPLIAALRVGPSSSRPAPAHLSLCVRSAPSAQGCAGVRTLRGRNLRRTNTSDQTRSIVRHKARPSVAGLLLFSNESCTLRQPRVPGVGRKRYNLLAAQWSQRSCDAYVTASSLAAGLPGAEFGAINWPFDLPI